MGTVTYFIPQGKLCQPKLMQLKSREILGKMMVNGLEKQKLGQYHDLFQALKGEHLSALGSQQCGPSFLHPLHPTAGQNDRKQKAHSNLVFYTQTTIIVISGHQT